MTIKISITDQSGTKDFEFNFTRDEIWTEYFGNVFFHQGVNYISREFINRELGEKTVIAMMYLVINKMDEIKHERRENFVEFVMKESVLTGEVKNEK